MCAQANILLMTADPGVSAAVAQALTNGHLLAGGTARDPRELAGQLQCGGAGVVLVDLDPEPRQVLIDLERLISRFPLARFVALSGSIDSDLLMDAMQAGIRRVLVKQSIRAELQGVLNRLTSTDQADARARGTLCTVLSASGGCGATTIAVNLTEELGQQTPPALIIDLDDRYGAVAPYLGIEARYAVDHVLGYSGPVDANLISTTATQHSTRIHVLASPASMRSSVAAPLDLSRIDQVCDSARRAYRSIVVDAPRVTADVAAALVGQSALVLLVMQLTVKDIRIARTTLDALRERCVEMSHIVPVANRYVRRQMISLEEAGKALGGLSVRPIRNDYAAAIQGLNFGQTLAECSPRSVLRRDIQELVALLVPVTPKG
jgi:pilus assembly protein CpaE